MANYQRILVPIDFSRASEQVIEGGLSLAKASNASLHLLHVVEFLPPIDFAYEPITTPDWFANEETLVKQARSNLEARARQHALDTANCFVLVGAPQHEIVRFAREQGMDLIVIGSHGRHGIQRLLGSTVHPVLNNAECDVLAIRIHD